MAGDTTFTFLDATGVTKTARAGSNVAGDLAPSAVLYDVNGNVLIGQKARAGSVPVALSTEDVAALSTLATQPISGTVEIANDVGNPIPTLEQSRAAAAADVNAPAVNTAAVVTYAASPGVAHVIGGIAWSYNAAPTGGNLKVEDVSGTTVFSIDITAAGPGFIPFARPKKSAAQNTALIVTLAAAGAAVTGKVSVLSHWTE